MRFTFPDGGIEEARFNAGDAAWFPETEHSAENLSDQPAEMVFVEFKG